MFKKEDVDLSSDKANTLIGKDTLFNGTISGKDVIRIDGKAEGNITNQNDVYVGESGNVNAEIKAKNVIIAGVFQGTIEASGRLEIKRTGKAVGSFVANAFVVEDGAVLSGNLDMKDKEKLGKPVEQVEKSLDAPDLGVKTPAKI
jgi:cytoskeletal protein CcmA (bactofilin family)